MDLENLKGHVEYIKEDCYKAKDSFGELKRTSELLSSSFFINERDFLTKVEKIENSEKITYNLIYDISKFYIDIIIKERKSDQKIKTIIHEHWKYDNDSNITEYYRYDDDTLIIKELASFIRKTDSLNINFMIKLVKLIDINPSNMI